MDGLPPTPREIAKRTIYSAYCAIVAPGKSKALSRARSQRVSILCYHRVNDEFRDNVTLGIDHFDRQIALIKRTYNVVRAKDIVTGDIDRSSERPIVAVSFDDGYLDNYENAVPILKKHKVPAIFFVSTGIVGTDRGFEHDIEKIGRPLANMTWDHLREMHADGFEIGAHTVNHVNIAQVDDALAERELCQSRDRIREEIGITDISYAYCFGKRTDITPARRELVKALGYTSCFSAYGGTNDGEIDRFDIKRFGVNYGFSESAFRARIEGCSIGGTS